MTLLDENANQTAGATAGQQNQQGGVEQRGQSQERRINVGENERVTSVAAGAILALFGLGRASLPGLVVAGVGGALAYRGITGHCSMYEAAGVDTAQESEQQIHVEQAFIINRPAEDLYNFWRN